MIDLCLTCNNCLTDFASIPLGDFNLYNIVYILHLLVSIVSINVYLPSMYTNDSSLDLSKSIHVFEACSTITSSPNLILSILTATTRIFGTSITGLL